MKPTSLLTLLSLVFFSLSCGTKQAAQPTGSATTEEQAIYDVLNFCLNSEQIAKGEKLLADETVHYSSVLSDWPYPDDDNRFLSKDDIAFMRGQDADTIPFTIEPQKLSRRVKMASSKKLNQWRTESRKAGLEQYWDNVYSEYGGGYATFSKPLFSKDYKTAVVAYGNHCGGLCGMGATYILRKGQDGWQIAEVFDNWIS